MKRSLTVICILFLSLELNAQVSGTKDAIKEIIIGGYGGFMVENDTANIDRQAKF